MLLVISAEHLEYALHEGVLQFAVFALDKPHLMVWVLRRHGGTGTEPPYIIPFSVVRIPGL